MKFDLKDTQQKIDAINYMEYLLKNECLILLEKKNPNRSNSQNNYLHALLEFCALEIGEDLEYFKQEIWKKIIAPDVFRSEYVNEKTGETRDSWKSSTELSTDQMGEAIDRLRTWASINLDIYLPDPTERSLLARLENQIRKNRRF